MFSLTLGCSFLPGFRLPRFQHLYYNFLSIITLPSLPFSKPFRYIGKTLKDVCKVPEPCLQNYQTPAGLSCVGIFMTFQNKIPPYLSRNAVRFILSNCNHLRVHLWAEPAIKSCPLLNGKRFSSSHLEKFFRGSAVNTLPEMFASQITEGAWQLFQSKL